MRIEINLFLSIIVCKVGTFANVKLKQRAMSSVQIKSNIDIALEDLIQGIGKLEGKELDSFIQQLLSIRARRRVNNLNERESELLELINESLPLEILERYQELDAKRRAETLTEEEHTALINITTEMEAQNVERIKYLSELALLRNTDLRSLMKQLGITPKNG